MQMLEEQQASAQVAAVLLKGISNITSTLAERYSEVASAKANTSALSQKQVSHCVGMSGNIWTLLDCQYQRCIILNQAPYGQLPSHKMQTRCPTYMGVVLFLQ